MRIYNLLVFDEIISGTSSTWYSRQDLQRILGNADAFAVQACVSNVSGTFPALTVASEHSSDSLNWAVTNNTEINAVLISEGGSYAGTSGLVLVTAAHIRFKITLGGGSPKCRLELYVTGHGHGNAAREAAAPRVQPASTANLARYTPLIVFSGLVFDQLLTGTASTWYTSARFNDSLGLGDELSIHAITTGVSGVGPTITCQIETSANGKDWYSAQATAEINGAAISNDATNEGGVAVVSVILQKFVRIRIALGGLSPACRLKLYATGRSFK